MNYELTDETIEYAGRTLHRIRALVDIPYNNVEAGDLGGFIEKVENLQGNAWVFGNAKVYGDALVFDHAVVSGNAVVLDNAMVFENAKVFGKSFIFDNAKIFGGAEVGGHTWVSGNAEVYEDILEEFSWVHTPFEEGEEDYV